MKSLPDIIHAYFPNEIIARQEKIKLTDSLWQIKLSSVPLSGSKMFYMKPVYFTETDKRYYFDLRETISYQNRLSILTTPLFIFGFLFLSQYLLKAAYPPVFYLFAVLIGLLVPFYNFFYARSLSSIKVIDKQWATPLRNENGKTVLAGQIPHGEQYLFSYIRDLQSKLPFEEKIMSGLIFGDLPRHFALGGEFLFEYRPVV